MDKDKAKELLEKIAKAKTANFGLGSLAGAAADGLKPAGNMAAKTLASAAGSVKGAVNPLGSSSKPAANANSVPKFDMLGEAMNKLMPFKTKQTIQLENNEAHRDAIRTLVMTAIGGTALGGGYAALNHFNHTPSPKKENKTKRVVEMPVPYYEKEGGDENVTSPYGLSYYLPGLVLGGVGGGALAWKGVDKMLKNKRQREIEENTNMARAEYENAMKDMYKRSDDNNVETNLDKAFDGLEKKADLTTVPGISEVNQAMSTVAPNAWGTAKGLLLANALIGLPVGYSLVNHQVKKNSRRKLVDDAMKERARLRATQSPAEIYAVPTPIE